MNSKSEKRWNRAIRFIDGVAKPLVVASVCMYLLEGELTMQNDAVADYQSPALFRWFEGVVAILFTFEFLLRWWRSMPKFVSAPTTSYPLNAWGAIDLLAIIPFWLEFFVPAEYLGILRTFRILHLLKFFRYSRTLQLSALKFYRAYHNMKGIAFSIFVVWLFFAVLCINLEYPYQPEKFGSLFDAAWFTIVTATTVGYGDVAPIGFWGKVFVGMMLIPIISTMGMAFSAFSNACDTVQQLEDDPAVDPIAEWNKERQRMRERKQANRDYHIDQ